MDIMSVITGILVPTVIGILGWAGRMQKAISDLRVHIAESYTSQEAMKEVVAPLRRQIDNMQGVLYQIAAKLNINAHVHRTRDEE